MKRKNNSSPQLVTKGFLELKLNTLKQEIDENAKQYRDQILTKLDGVMGELETMRQENTIGAYQTSELREQVGDHEKRIKHLEKVQQAA